MAVLVGDNIVLAFVEATGPPSIVKLLIVLVTGFRHLVLHELRTDGLSGAPIAPLNLA